MAENHPMTFDDLIRVPRISGPSLHPSGNLVAFERAAHDPVENRVRRTVVVVDVETHAERELTPGSQNDHSPVWSPDGRLLAFVSDRTDDEQLWILPFEEGGEGRCLTKGLGGVSQPTWAPDSRRIAFSRTVSEPELRREETKQPDTDQQARLRAEAFGLSNHKSSARVAENLLFRHWNRWRDGRRNRLQILDIVTEELRTVSPAGLDVPPVSLGGSRDFVFSPDGAEITYVANPDEVVATSTNNSLFVQKLAGVEPDGEPWCISETDAMERDPRYSPDGTRVAYLGAEQPGYEADRMRIKVYDRAAGTTTTLTEGFDRSARELVWRDDGEILFLAADRGYVSIYGVTTDGDLGQYTSGLYQQSVRLRSRDEVIVTRESLQEPPDIYTFHLEPSRSPELSNGEGQPVRFGSTGARLTSAYTALEGVSPMQTEQFWYAGADDDPVHGFLVLPPDFDPAQRYPTILLIHGGPQSAFADHFHFRWNAAVFAGAGYVVAMTNPRGSVGYGQRFTDQISGDWGGRCYEDIMRGVDHLVTTYPFIDSNRLAAAGGSFGGYMISWIAGHTDRFSVLVCHDGIFNQESMSYTTDELWFDIWEHGGMPFEDPERFRRQSPHLFVDRFTTPMLVIQGGRDYRCPVGEGIGLFQALQTRDVPSQLLYFDDEGHFVTQPANAEVWYKSVLGFIGRYV